MKDKSHRTECNLEAAPNNVRRVRRLISWALLLPAALALALPKGFAQTPQAEPDRVPKWLPAAHEHALSVPVQSNAQQITPATIPALQNSPDQAGWLGVYQPGGSTATAGNAFFQTLGTNGVTCFTCHQPSMDMSFTPLNAQVRYAKYGLKDPLFVMVDGANCPSDNPFKPSSFSQTLFRGNTRIFLPIPPNAQFSVSVADDPTGCENDPAWGIAATGDVSLYRRPLPATNTIFKNIVNSSPRLHCLPPANGLGTTGYTGSMTAGSNTLTLTTAPERTLFIGEPVLVVGAGTVNPPNGGINLNLLVTTVAGVTSSTVYTLAAPAVNTVNGIPVNTKGSANGELGIGESCDNIMWDGREPDLSSQFIDATLIHAQATATPTATQIQQGVSFQNGLFTAQSSDLWAGDLSKNGATGGVLAMPGLYPDGQDSVAGKTQLATFDLFNAWSNPPGGPIQSSKRKSINNGEFIFNSVVMQLTGIAGFSDKIGPGEGLLASCNTCHNVKNVGGEALYHVVNTGVASGAFVAHPSDLPLFTLTCTSGDMCQPTAPGETCYDSSSGGAPYPPLPSNQCSPQAPCIVTTDDPGRALISGNCDDIGSFITPALRGIGARAPYFHDGSAATLEDVVTFYNNRFAMCVPATTGGTCTPEPEGLTASQITDVANFLRSL